MTNTLMRPMPSWAYLTEPQAFTLVLAGPNLSKEHINTTWSAIQATDSSKDLNWIKHTEHCVEAQFVTLGASAFAVLEALGIKLSDIDVLVLPQAQRTKSLLICDMDSTIIPTESLDELAEFMDLGEKIGQITTKAMNGEIEFAQALEQRVKLLKGLSEKKIQSCVEQTQLNHGAKELLEHTRQQGVRTVLVSGGFAPFVQHVADTLGFDHWVANQLEIKNGKLTGKVVPPIVDKETKLNVLKQECEKLAIDPEQSVCIGDGANDIEMLTASGCGLAYRAKKIVLESTPYHLQHGDFSTLNYWLNFEAAASE